MELPDFLILDGIDLRRSGGTFIARCPFHEERSPSFTVWPDHAHCYGCGWHGGIFKYVMERWSCDYEGAKKILRDRGCSPPARRIANFKSQIANSKEKPELPELWPLNEDGIHALAKLRCLSPAGIRRASKAGVLFGCRWPQYLKHGKWSLLPDAKNCWAITDESRNVVQFRTFDGSKLKIVRRDEKTGEPTTDYLKSWTKGSPSWPVGAAGLAAAKNPNVIIVEGGADLLAAYHLLASIFKVGKHFVSPDFTPVAMLGASNSIGPAALPLFTGKRVRILRHDDEPGKNGKIPGVEAAARWRDQLVTAGASVATCCFSRLSSQKQMVDALLDFAF